MNHFTTKTVSVLDVFAELWKVTVSFDMSIRPSVWSHWTDVHEIWVFFENLSRKCKFHYNLITITEDLQEDICTFMVSCWILFKMRNVSYESCRENQNTHVMFNNSFFPPARQATDNTIRRMCVACWITKATNTHSEYVVLAAFSRQQWLRERVSVVRLCEEVIITWNLYGM